MTRMTYKAFARLRRKPIPAAVLHRPIAGPTSVEFVSGVAHRGPIAAARLTYAQIFETR